MRYSRLQSQVMTEDQIKENLLFAGEKPGETMTVGMTKARRQGLVRRHPADLSVIARSRGADWLYTYLPASTVERHPRQPAGTTSCSTRSACRT